MGTIKYGTTEFSNLKVGNSQVSEVRVGNDLVWRAELLKLAEIDNGVNNRVVISDSSTVYVGGEDGVIYYYDTNLANGGTFSTNYGGVISGMVRNSTHLFVTGLTTNKVYKYSLSTKTKVAESIALEGINSYFGELGMSYDSTYLYVGIQYYDGSLMVAKLYKYNLSNLALVSTYTDTIYSSYSQTLNDSTYIYALRGGVGGSSVRKILKSNMTLSGSYTLNMSPELGSYWTQDTDYLYLCDYDGQMRKLLKSDLSVTDSASNGEAVYNMTMVGDYLYVLGAGYLRKYDKDFNLIKSVSKNSVAKRLSFFNPSYSNSSYIFAVSKDSNYITKYTL